MPNVIYQEQNTMRPGQFRLMLLGYILLNVLLVYLFGFSSIYQDPDESVSAFAKQMASRPEFARFLVGILVFGTALILSIIGMYFLWRPAQWLFAGLTLLKLFSSLEFWLGSELYAFMTETIGRTELLASISKPGYTDLSGFADGFFLALLFFGPPSKLFSRTLDVPPTDIKKRLT